MKLCPYCGQEMNDEEQQCPACGKRVGTEEPLYIEPDENAQSESAGEYDEPGDMPRPVGRVRPETRRADAERRVRRMSPPPAEEGEAESYDPFSGAKAFLGSKCASVIGYVSGKNQVKGWQIAVACLGVVSAIVFIVAACLGGIYALAGVPAALTLSYFILKKPKFNAVCMLIPLLVFMLCSLSMSASFHGAMDYSAKVSDIAGEMTELRQRYYDNLIDYTAYKAAEAEFNSKYDMDALNDSGEDMSDTLSSRYGVMEEPAEADTVIFRVILIAMTAAYLLSLLGVIRKTAVTTYIMLGAGAAEAVYFLIKLLSVYADGYKVYYLAALLFMLAVLIFVVQSDKTEQMRKSRALYRLLHITDGDPKEDEGSHPYDTMGGGVLAAHIASYVIAGALCLLGVYVIILMIVTLSRLSDIDFGGGYKFWYVMISLFQSALLFCASYIAYMLAGKIARRDDSFLKHWHILAFICLSFVFILCSTPIISNWGLVAICAGAFVVLALPTLYFVRSKRVYVYMDTNKYLLQSVFTKKLQPPKL